MVLILWGRSPSSRLPARSRYPEPTQVKAAGETEGCSRGRVCLARGFGWTRQCWSVAHCSFADWIPWFPPALCPSGPSANSETLPTAQHPGRGEHWVNTDILSKLLPTPCKFAFQSVTGTCWWWPLPQAGLPQQSLALLAAWPPGVTRGPYLAAVHTAFQVASTDHGGGDDATVNYYARKWKNKPWAQEKCENYAKVSHPKPKPLKRVAPWVK